MVWSAEAADLGEIVVKARYGDRAGEKTRWCATNMPLLAARGYPAPEILWHGVLGGSWYLRVERRLRGVPLRSVNGRRLRRLRELVELQADAGLDAETASVRDFAGYQSYVLFDDWDHVWRDAHAVSREAAEVCDRVRRWLRPVWGYRLEGRDFAHNDFNLTNILADGDEITGVVDWDEFGVNTRATDLTALAFDCVRQPPKGSADGDAVALLNRAAEIAGDEALRCLVGYRVVSHLAALARRGEREGVTDSARRSALILGLAGAP
jgi:aminoglycoside phosphotransferase